LCENGSFGVKLEKSWSSEGLVFLSFFKKQLKAVSGFLKPRAFFKIENR